jgi:hypothetical protein
MGNSYISYFYISTIYLQKKGYGYWRNLYDSFVNIYNYYILLFNYFLKSNIFVFFDSNSLREWYMDLQLELCIWVIGGIHPYWEIVFMSSFGLSDGSYTGTSSTII